MWRKLWNWLRGTWNWILGLFHAQTAPSESPPEPRQLTEAGYERIMRRVLDRLDPEFDQQALHTFLRDDRISEASLADWLQRSGERWLREGDADRKARLGQLGKQLDGELGKAALSLHQRATPAQAPTRPQIPVAQESLTATPSSASIPKEVRSVPEAEVQEIERLFQQGLALAGADRRQEAITFWDMAIALDDTQARLWSHRGMALVDLNLHEQALISLNKALALAPEEGMALASRGEALVELGRYGEALPDLETSVQLDPTAVEAWYFQGHALLHLHRFEEAIRCFDRALQLQPILHIAWIGRSDATLRSTYAALSATGTFHQSPALNQRGRDGALATLRAGQRCCTQQEHPLKWQDLQDKIVEVSRSALG